MDEKYVTKHDLYEKLWASRDFEINHLWQRSIFLATFIVALFTIYFSVLNTFVSNVPFEDIKVVVVDDMDAEDGVSVFQDEKSAFALIIKDSSNESLTDNPCFQLIVLDIICVFGFLFSVLWICMAKGSKYMYERHERGIEAAHDNGSFDKDLQREIDIESYEILWNLGDYTYIPRHGALPLSDYDYHVFHHNGARYSSSKINIAIGYIFVFGWILLTGFNSIMIDSGSVFCRFIWFMDFLILECLLALYVAFKVLSDNSMEYGNFVRLIKYTFSGSYNPDGNQIDWISKFFATKNYVIDYVGTILSRYRDSCDNPLQRNILDEFKGHETELAGIRKLLSNEQLKTIFETALMYRIKIPHKFCSSWITAQGEPDSFIIQIDNIDFYVNGIKRKLIVNEMYHLQQKSNQETRLYADTDWRRIRAGFKDYDLIDNARTMHLISKEMNGSTVYMTLSFPDSISDKEFHYGKEPIPSDKFRILHVKYIEINKAYDKPISFEMDYIRDEKQCSDD